MGPLLHLQERRKDLLAGRVQQERGLAVLAGAADRADEVSEQAARHVGREGHRDLAGAEPARTEPRHSAYTCGAADGGDGFQLRRVARDGEPVVALHVIAGLCDERAADRMAAGRVAGEKAERVAVDTRVALTAHGGALGVGNAGVHVQARGLTFARQLDRALRGEVPGVIEIEIGDLAGQRAGVHQPGIRILGGVTGDRTGLFHRLAHRGSRQVRGARRALALPEVDGHSEAAVALILERVDLAQPHAHRQPLGARGVGFALRGALAARFLERETGDVSELPDCPGFGWWLHRA